MFGSDRRAKLATSLAQGRLRHERASAARAQEIRELEIAAQSARNAFEGAQVEYANANFAHEIFVAGVEAELRRTCDPRIPALIRNYRQTWDWARNMIRGAGVQRIETHRADGVTEIRTLPTTLTECCESLLRAIRALDALALEPISGQEVAKRLNEIRASIVWVSEAQSFSRALEVESGLRVVPKAVAE
jgi:hypothetical protein